MLRPANVDSIEGTSGSPACLKGTYADHYTTLLDVRVFWPSKPNLALLHPDYHFYYIINFLFTTKLFHYCNLKLLLIIHRLMT